jgi:hypothetical protein
MEPKKKDNTNSSNITLKKFDLFNSKKIKKNIYSINKYIFIKLKYYEIKI